MIATCARRILFTVIPSGRNRGNMTEDMNSMLISGHAADQFDVDHAQSS